MRKTAPVFIGGAHRSGSTLLVDLLGVHPALSPVYDTEFVIEIAEVLFASPNLTGEQMVENTMQIMDGFTRMLPLRPVPEGNKERYHHGPHHIMFDRDQALGGALDMLSEAVRIHPLEAFRNMIERIYACHCAWDRKERWINKLHVYVRCLPFLLDAFPGMKFLHVVRDGRDIACSLKAGDFGELDIEWATAAWSESVMAGLNFEMSHPESIHVVRYEELVLQPERTLNRVLTWLGEPTMGEEILQSWCGGDGMLRRSSVGRWLNELTEQEKQAYWAKNGGLLTSMGYGLDPITPSAFLPDILKENRL